MHTQLKLLNTPEIIKILNISKLRRFSTWLRGDMLYPSQHSCENLVPKVCWI